MKTPQQIIDDCNRLARRFMSMHGFNVPDGFRFDRSQNGRGQLMWRLAVEAYEFIEATPVEDAFSELENLGDDEEAMAFEFCGECI